MNDKALSFVELWTLDEIKSFFKSSTVPDKNEFMKVLHAKHHLSHFLSSYGIEEAIGAYSNMVVRETEMLYDPL